MKICPPADLTYIAGFVDGEGCITLVPRKKKGKCNGYFARISIANTNLEILTWIKSYFGGCLSLRKRRSPRHKPAWELLFSEIQAEEFVKVIMPWLRIKRRQAKVLLEYRRSVAATKHYPDRSGLSPTIRMERDALYGKIRQLNQKGPALVTI